MNWLENLGSEIDKLRADAKDDTAPPFTASLRHAPIIAPAIPDESPLVSVIVLNRDGGAMLDRMLASFAKFNRYPAIEILLVDHGSKDDSLTVAERWRGELPLTVFRCEQNYSFSYSCNRAAEFAKGEFLLLLNNDIVFTEDVLGPMVAAAQQAGIVGMKLLRPRGPAGTLRPCHIGVRFRWNLKYGSVGPYNVLPAPGDSVIGNGAAAFPSVTAAIMLCRRGDYLAVGGLWEGYTYGYEDIDFCLKFRLGLEASILCLNNISAIHGDGRTRKTQISQKRRSIWDRRNLMTFASRFGYAMRRELLCQLFADDGSYSGRRPGVAFAGIAIDGKVESFATALREQRFWNVRQVRPSIAGHMLRGIDLLFMCDPDYPLGPVRHRNHLMMRIGWLAGGLDRWRDFDCSIFDLVLVSDEKERETVTQTIGIPALIFDPAAPNAVADLIGMILDYVANRHRIAIKLEASAPEADASRLAAILRRAGHHVRIDRPSEWMAPHRLRDDVAILLPGFPPCAPQPGKINLAFGEPNDRFVADAFFPLSEPETMAREILAAITQLHPIRMRGPADNPLVARIAQEDSGQANWNAPPSSWAPTP